MTELLTSADIETIIGWCIGAYGIGWCAGKVMLEVRRMVDML